MSLPPTLHRARRLSLAALSLLALAAPASPLTAQPAQTGGAPRGQAPAPAAPTGADLAAINQALRAAIEKQDPSTAEIFNRNPNFQILRPPPPAPAAPAAVPTIPRDAGPWTPNNFTNAKPNLPTLVIAGDSTAQTGSAGQRGWGALLVDYFDPTKINLVNPSIGGRSFRSFYYEGRWDNVVNNLKPGDIVMIQFGHNDGNGGGVENPNGRPSLAGIGEETQDVTRADGRVETVHTLGWYARKFVADVRAKGATPILMTTTAANQWNNGVFARTGSNEGRIRQVAAQEQVLLFDHTRIISDYYEKLGQSTASTLFTDRLHTTTSGAIINAEMFIAGAKTLDLKTVVDALNDKGKAIPAAAPAPAAPAP